MMIFVKYLMYNESIRRAPSSDDWRTSEGDTVADCVDTSKACLER